MQRTHFHYIDMLETVKSILGKVDEKSGVISLKLKLIIVENVKPNGMVGNAISVFSSIRYKSIFSHCGDREHCKKLGTENDYEEFDCS